MRPQIGASLLFWLSKNVKLVAFIVLFYENSLFLQHLSCTLRKKVLPSTYFWCFSLSQIEDSIQNLEGPNGIWKHQWTPICLSWCFPDTVWSFQVLNIVLYL